MLGTSRRSSFVIGCDVRAECRQGPQLGTPRSDFEGIVQMRRGENHSYHQHQTALDRLLAEFPTRYEYRALTTHGRIL